MKASYLKKIAMVIGVATLILAVVVSADTEQIAKTTSTDSAAKTTNTEEVAKSTKTD